MKLDNYGVLGFITPDSWLTNNNASSIRKLFIEQGSLSSILDTYKVFSDAPDVWCNIPIFHKNKICKTIQINRNYPFDLSIFQFETKWSNIVKYGSSQWFPYINNDLQKIFTKMNKNDVIENYFDVRRGFSPTPNATNITRAKTNRQIIGGEDFGRYLSKIKPKYLIAEYSKSTEQINNIQNKNILAIQRIRTNSLQFNSRWIISQYFDKSFIPIDSIGYFLQSELLDLKFLMAILNSKLMNLYYKLHFTDKNVKPIYLKKLPIINRSAKEQQPFIKQVNLMLELNQKLQNSKQNFINDLELEKITRKIQNFELLTFDEFIKEFIKSKKLKFANKLEERKLKDEWRSLFENDTKIVLNLKSKIDMTEKEINDMVYKLYGLSDDEVTIIEGSI